MCAPALSQIERTRVDDRRNGRAIVKPIFFRPATATAGRNPTVACGWSATRCFASTAEQQLRKVPEARLGAFQPIAVITSSSSLVLVRRVRRSAGRQTSFAVHAAAHERPVRPPEPRCIDRVRLQTSPCSACGRDAPASVRPASRKQSKPIEISWLGCDFCKIAMEGYARSQRSKWWQTCWGRSLTEPTRHIRLRHNFHLQLNGRRRRQQGHR